MLTLPALKVQQFGQEFYLLNLAAQDVERLVRFEVLGDAGLQGKRTRKAGAGAVVNWQEIEHRVQTSEKAFQRPILRKKVEELANYYLQCHEDGSLPAIPGAVILTLDQTVEFTPTATNPFLGLVQLPQEEGALRVLDGQHRLLALAALLHKPDLDDGKRGVVRMLQVPAILFAGMPSPAIIEMFVTINAKHTRLNPSLLTSLSGKKLFAEPRAALVHDVIKRLNSEAGSPLKGHVKMFGTGPGAVQQSSLAQELHQAFEEIERRLPNQVQELEKNADKLLLNYFKEVALVFEGTWESKKYATRTTAALRAFLRVAPDVVERGLRTGLNGREALRAVMAPWRERVGAERFELAGAWRLKHAGSGKETVRILARELAAALGGVA